MNTELVVITLSSLLLLAYLFDLTASITRIPSVILLLALGWLVRRGTDLMNIHLPDLSGTLPVFGTIGLILIVLDGALEVEIHRSRFGLITKSFLGSLFSILLLAAIFTGILYLTGSCSIRTGLINSVPLCVISSAIAIPTARQLVSKDREFTVYESSFSDIIGVLFFNVIVINESFELYTVGHFFLQILLMIVVSFAATTLLSYFLNRIEHHVKFGPIILLTILIYGVAKMYHLPALLFILIFGLFLGNLDALKKFKWIAYFKPDKLDTEVQKFKELTVEIAFLIRALFFLLFGYLIETREILNSETLAWAMLIVALIFCVRYIQLKLSGLPARKLLFIAPRGLITILLFLQVQEDMKISLINRSLVLQVIILTALVMMIGMMRPEKKQTEETAEIKDTGNNKVEIK